jgi:hypothetical protein
LNSLSNKINNTVRQFLFIFLSTLFIFSSCDSPRTLVVQAAVSDIDSALEIAGIKHNRMVSLVATHEGREDYVMYIEQPIDHKAPEKGSFLQKVYLSHVDMDAPVVMYLSGYNAPSNSYLTEPTQLLKANQLFIEHRFFGESLKEGSPEWESLNIAQSAADVHHIKEVMDDLYSGKWMSTGISKGGQMVMYHKAYYPEDVSASIAYVAPLNRAQEDSRIYEFLDAVGTEECRKKVKAVQIELLMHYDRSLSMFKAKAAEKKLISDLTIEQFFELSIFEYEFAFWQWNGDCNGIPALDASLEEKVAHLFNIGAPGFFTTEVSTDLFPFFYQAYSEMGMYGYRVNSFKDLTRFYQKDFSNYRTFIPEKFNLVFNARTHEYVQERLTKVGRNMIFIQGSLDPWSSTGFIPSGSTNSVRFNVEGGTHKSRMKDLDLIQNKSAKDSLMKWMNTNQ